MERPYTQIDVSKRADISCVRLRHAAYDEIALEELGAELGRLIDEDGCRKLVLNLGPGQMDCLYSVFLAKTVNLQRRLQAAGGALALAQLSAFTKDIFRAAGLEKYFQFYATEQEAVQALQST
ncbi:MAG: hypothetical protein L0Y72_07730 [Gemmataceae bacterium]|nr:hypothetical protein [Gemmataceae bacterium]MCI0738919.1 hypothetical protein [Gemmataceae bacterium]